ncbi:MAG: nucleoside monophosphate kinase [Bryobacterales bacterium]|nr:nucleoside monophosphate kinase [Bryobacterales bacterium]
MILLLFGPPGSGKGTQARLISQWLGIPSVSTGDLLRAEVASGSPLGQQLESLLAAGQYVPDALVNQIVIHQLERSTNGMILDGYPRTEEQAEFLKKALADRNIREPIAVHLEVSDTAIVARLGARRVCPKCRRVFSLVQNPPKQAGFCDDCDTQLTTRTDDTPETVLQRLRTYAELTAPIFAHFHNSLPINGNQKPENVFYEIQEAMAQVPEWVSQNTRLGISPTSCTT